MKIEPNTDIGMQAETVLCHSNSIEFVDGKKMDISKLHETGNAFDKLCESIDPNVTFINVVIPVHDDDEYYFKIRDYGQKKGIHVQSLKQRPEEAWRIWEYYKSVHNQPNADEG